MYLQGNAQSIPMYSQYMYNMVNINPAYAGSRGVPSLSLLWREQWSGMPGSPTTKSVTYDMPMKDKQYGIGIQMFDDKYVNYIRRTGANLYYSLKIPISEKGVLSMGLKAGFYNDLKLLTSVDLGPIKAYDPAFASNFNNVIPLAGAGVYYNDDHLYVGFSSPDIITFSSVKNYASDKSLYQVNARHFFLTAGYSVNLNEDVSVKPSFLLKATSGAPIQVDVNTNLWLKNMIGLGVSYRSSESVLAMLEAQLTPQLRFGYAYDMPFNRPNSHELFMRIEIGGLFPNEKSYKIY
jgi:type IX secretion system PorP/SprF family membrane protein